MGMKPFNIALIAFVLCIIGGFWYSAEHYHDKYQAEKKRADNAEYALTAANATIADMAQRQADVAAIDAKYTRELNDAKKTISGLRRDVDSGTKRLRIAATCNVRKAASTASVDDATRPRLNDTAQRDYFTLRERIETSTAMINGLQEYIRTQCLK